MKYYLILAAIYETASLLNALYIGLYIRSTIEGEKVTVFDWLTSGFFAVFFTWQAFIFWKKYRLSEYEEKDQET